MTDRVRRGGKGKKWSFAQHESLDLAGATLYALAAAEYHLKAVKSYEERLMERGSWGGTDFTPSGNDSFNKMYHHLRAFFWELTAAFDTLLQEINRRLSLTLGERDVSWDTVSRVLSQQRKYRALLKRLDRGFNSRWFTEVREYRNFAHRGTVMVEYVAMAFSTDPTPKVVGLQLTPIAAGRGIGDPARICEYYHGQTKGFIEQTLAELDALAPASSEETSALE